MATTAIDWSAVPAGTPVIGKTQKGNDWSAARPFHHFDSETPAIFYVKKPDGKLMEVPVDTPGLRFAGDNPSPAAPTAAEIAKAKKAADKLAADQQRAADKTEKDAKKLAETAAKQDAGASLAASIGAGVETVKSALAKVMAADKTSFEVVSQDLGPEFGRLRLLVKQDPKIGFPAFLAANFPGVTPADVSYWEMVAEVSARILAAGVPGLVNAAQAKVLNSQPEGEQVQVLTACREKVGRVDVSRSDLLKYIASLRPEPTGTDESEESDEEQGGNDADESGSLARRIGDQLIGAAKANGFDIAEAVKIALLAINVQAAMAKVA